MKTIVLIFGFCICVGALTIEELKTKLHTEQSVCATETGIDQQKANDVIQGNVDVEDKKVQLYSECILKKFNVLDKNGVFKPQGIALVMELLIDENAVKQLLSECSTISEDNVYLKASKLVQCFSKYKTMKATIEELKIKLYGEQSVCMAETGKAKVIQGNVDVEDKNVQVYFTKHKCLTIKDFQTALRLGQSMCSAQTGVNQQIVDDVNDANVNMEDENVLLYIECAMKKFNIVDEDGNLNESVNREISKMFLDENEVEQMITDCSSISDTDVHIKIIKIFQCIMKYKTITEMLNA
ncbi:General odorant-binding6d [Apis cerana cerana]|uniref:General odorant-binding6d n=1 Tax=Apis cerana cerana TaxID=94128 RepID=A0A2A3EG92_APICC|nr:General odorant-binding6d [Apis cerana cerana]